MYGEEKQAKTIELNYASFALGHSFYGIVVSELVSMRRLHLQAVGAIVGLCRTILLRRKPFT